MSLAARFSRPFYAHVVWKYYWGPIAADAHGLQCMTVDGVQACGGYNLVNTASWALLLGLLLLWAYRLLAEWRDTMDTEFTVAIVPYLVWGSVYHVLEDADLFAPFGQTEPGTSFFDKYLGAFFITPLIWVEIVLVVVLVYSVGRWAQRVGERRGLGAGLQFYAYFLLALFGLYLALWISQPAFVKHLTSPFVVLVGALLSFLMTWWDARRLGRVSPRTVTFATGIGFLFVGLFYVVTWQTRSSPTWGLPADVEPKWWVLGALVVGVGLFVAFLAGLARALSGPRSTTRTGEERRATVHLSLLIVLTILGGLVVLYGALGACRLADPAGPGSSDYPAPCHDARYGPTAAWASWIQVLAIPVVFYVLIRLSGRWAQGTLGTRPMVAVFAHPVNLLMAAGQMTDAFMTSLGIDFYGYQEKHVLPSFLIEQAGQLPGALGDFATTVVMIPLKLLIVLAVVWLIDVSGREERAGRENLMGLVKLAILMVGLSPGVRDAVRVAMVT